MESSNLNNNDNLMNQTLPIFLPTASQKQPAPTATSNPPSDGNKQTDLEIQWENSVGNLSPIWADIEIVGLCLLLLVMEAALSMPTAYVLNDDGLINWTCNRLNYLIEYSDAGDQFKELASESVDIAGEVTHSTWNGEVYVTPNSAKEARNDEFNALKDFFQSSNANYLDTLQERICNGELLLPDDDGTALFCLILVCGAAAGVEYEKGTPGFGYEFFKYTDPDYKYNGVILGPTYCYYYMCSHFGQSDVNEWLKFYQFDETSTYHKNYYTMQWQAIKLWENNDGPIFWEKKNGHITYDVPSISNEQATENAETMYNTYEADQYVIQPDDFFDPDQPMPPFDPSAPSSYVNPWGGTGNDVYSKTCLMLEWMQVPANWYNINGPIVFLLYLSSLANAGVFTENPELADIILSIGNGTTSLVDECVDITMMQLCLNGATPDAAEAEIDALFPGDDPVSIEVRNEAAREDTELNADLAEDPNYFNEMDESDLEDQWYAYISDPATEASMTEAESEIRVEMVESTNLITAFIALILLIEQSLMYQLDGYTEMSDWLAEETNELNTLQSEFTTPGYFDDQENIEEWIEQMQELQEELNDSPYLDQDTKDNLNTQFENMWNLPAMEENGDTYSPADCTVGEAIEDAETDPTDPESWDVVDTSLEYYSTPQPTLLPDGSLNPDAGLPAGGQTILLSFQNIDTILTDQSQMTTTLIQQLMQELQMIENMLNQMLNGDTGIASMESTMVNNQKA